MARYRRRLRPGEPQDFPDAYKEINGINENEGQLMSNISYIGESNAKVTPGEAVREFYRRQGAAQEKTRIIEVLRENFIDNELLDLAIDLILREDTNNQPPTAA